MKAAVRRIVSLATLVFLFSACSRSNRSDRLFQIVADISAERTPSKEQLKRALDILIVSIRTNDLVKVGFEQLQAHASVDLLEHLVDQHFSAATNSQQFGRVISVAIRFKGAIDQGRPASEEENSNTGVQGIIHNNLIGNSKNWNNAAEREAVRKAWQRYIEGLSRINAQILPIRHAPHLVWSDSMSPLPTN